mgnify:CR=1 FL=1
MPLHKSSPDVVRIDLPHPGEWVEVKAKMGRGDQRAIAKRLLRGRKPGDMNGLDSFDAGDLYEAAFFTMEVVFTGWSFEEPVTPENIRDLDDESVAVINERLQELYPQARDEDERKNSSGPTSGPSNPEAKSRKSSAG